MARAVEAKTRTRAATRHTRRGAHKAVVEAVFAAEPFRVPDPGAAVANAVRLRAFRQGLIDRGALTIDQLAEGRGQATGTASKWLRRCANAGEVFTVKVDGRVLLPLSLLDPAFDPIPAWRDVLTHLRGAGLDGWALWAWIDAPHSLLSGEIPSDLIISDPDRVVLAAERYARQLLG